MAVQELRRLVHRVSGTESYLVNPHLNSPNRIWRVNETVVEVWRALANGISVGSVQAHLSRYFDLPDSFSAQAVHSDLLRMASASTAGSDAPPDTTVSTNFQIETHGVPSHGTIDLTRACNLRCVHCYVRDLSQFDSTPHLQAGQWCGILDRITEAGCVFLSMTGGEPLSHPGFIEVYTHAAENGLVPTLLTNATFVNSSTIALLKRFPPLEVHISVYGTSRHSYEAVVQTAGAYDRWRRGLAMLAEAGLNIVLKPVILKQNRHEIEEMHELASNLGASLVVNAHIDPRLDGIVGPEAHRLDPEDVVQVQMAEYDPSAQTPWITEDRDTQSGIWDCAAGRVSFHIDHTGRLGYCAQVRSPGFDLQEIDMLEAWSAMLEKPLELFGRTEDCAECESRPYCMYCPGRPRAEHSPMGRSYFCRVADARRTFVQERRCQ